jgi:type II secretory pathway predicted ATPase ExeA
MEWYERYGWENNPFEVNPQPILIYGFNDIRKKVLEFIKSGDCCLIIGDAGSGKTLIVKWLEELNSPGIAFIYLNTLGMNEEELNKINIDSMVKEKSKSWPFRKKSIVMLIDDAQSLPTFMAEAVKRNFDENKIKSVVLTSNTEKLENLSGNLLEEVGDRKVILRPMTNEEAMGMLINRLKHKNPFELGSLEIIFQRAGYLPRNILELCESTAKANSNEVITKDFVERFLAMESSNKFERTELMDRLSPLQLKIVNILRTGNFTPTEIAEKLNKPTKTITSQLAYLGLKSGVKVMTRKGIVRPLIEKVSEKPAIYRLVQRKDI